MAAGQDPISSPGIARCIYLDQASLLIPQMLQEVPLRTGADPHHTRVTPVRPASCQSEPAWSIAGAPLPADWRWAEHQAEGEKAAWVGITIFSPVGNNTQTLSFHVFIFWEVYVFEY